MNLGISPVNINSLQTRQDKTRQVNFGTKLCIPDHMLRDVSTSDRATKALKALMNRAANDGRDNLSIDVSKQYGVFGSYRTWLEGSVSGGNEEAIAYSGRPLFGLIGGKNKLEVIHLNDITSPRELVRMFKGIYKNALYLVEKALPKEKAQEIAHDNKMERNIQGLRESA